MYRTVDTKGNPVETWHRREDVLPTLEYYKIQHIVLTGIDKRIVVLSEYNSPYELKIGITL